MPNFNPRINEENEREYGPDRDRPKDLGYSVLSWNHPLNTDADIARGTRREGVRHLDTDSSNTNYTTI